MPSFLCLPDLPPMSIGVQAEVADSDLTLVVKMGSDPSEAKLEVEEDASADVNLSILTLF